MIVCPANQTVSTEASQANAHVLWSAPHVTDNSRQSCTITCNVEFGSKFEIGETDVTCQAIDPGGNRDACSFTVAVTGRCWLEIQFRTLIVINFN